ncbi:MAG TPA: family 16 glycoside hydrolase, partial [Ktedonobacteraceae bacterium]|nr:family 16 glycoside hydrolase [Ktedonobacteraceae bacterium]
VSPFQNGAWPGNQDASASAWGAGGQGNGWQPNQNNLFGGQGSPMQQNSFGGGFSGANFPQNANASSFNNSFGGSGFQQNASQSAFGNSFGGSGFQQNAERPSMSSFFQSTGQNGYGGASAMTPERPSWARRPGREDDEEDGGKTRNRPGAGVIIVIVVLAVALIGGGILGGTYILKQRNGTTSNAPTITTPTGTPLFSDFFKNNKNGWDTNAPSGTKITLAGDGKLLLESDDGKLFPELVPGGKTFSDLRVDVDAGLTGGDPNNGYGVYIRTASTQNSALGLYYRFEVYGDGSFYIYKGYVDGNGKPQTETLKQSGPNNAVSHVGSVNHLTVEAKGQVLTFIINGTTVANFTDTNYKSGGVALFVSQVTDATTNAQAVFQNFAIFPMQ